MKLLLSYGGDVNIAHLYGGELVRRHLEMFHADKISFHQKMKH
ncbi:hypothetical protein L537_3463 [Bordetella hinzii 1277]|nr:hypothetical protein L537_3463 [Bordetella hinzii 1277]